MLLIKVRAVDTSLHSQYVHACVCTDNKKFTSGPNSFYCICDKHKEKSIPVDVPLEEKVDESEKKNKSFTCVIL